MKILGVETSCDETALAVLDTEKQEFERECVFSQIEFHRPFGGVVPGVAAQGHFDYLPALLKGWHKAGFDPSSLDAIAVTHGPGLIGCLALGVAFAKSLALVYQKPLQGVNHLRAHAFSCFIPLFEKCKGSFNIFDLLPHLGLLVSGGNTLLFVLKHENGKFQFNILAETVDDAAGEALDKGARLLGLSYPGGPEIEAHSLSGDPKAFLFPVAFKHTPEMKFSFSGLKTSLRYRLESKSEDWRRQNLSNLCASFQYSIVEALVCKTVQILKKMSFKSMGLSGGVSNNLELCLAFESLAKSYGLPLYLPCRKRSGDNAAMVAFNFFVEMLWNENKVLSLNPTLPIGN